MSAKNITNITGDGVRETTIASSSNKVLLSSGVKTSDSMEPCPSSSSSSTVQRMQDTMQVRIAVQTRSTGCNQTNYETASAEVESFKRLHKIIYGIINAWSKITTNKSSEFYLIWETKWKDKITAKQTFSGIKTRLTFNPSKTILTILFFAQIFNGRLIFIMILPQHRSNIEKLLHLPLRSFQ
jgi:hypothetical protein